MARDDRERETKKEETDEDKEDKKADSKRNPGIVIKSDPGKPAGRLQAAKSKSAGPPRPPWDGNGSHAAEQTGSRNSDRALPERRAKSLNAVSGNSYKPRRLEPPSSLAKTRAPLPSTWRPTPTKASILREEAAKAARAAKEKPSPSKTLRGSTRSRSTVSTISRASASKPLPRTPEKHERYTNDEPEDEEQQVKDPQRIDRRFSSPEASKGAPPPLYQKNENSPFDDDSDSHGVSNPIFALHRALKSVRRLNKSSTDESESSTWSAETAVRRPEAMPDPLYYAPAFIRDRLQDNSSSSSDQALPRYRSEDHHLASSTGYQRYISRYATSAQYVHSREESKSSSDRTLVNSRASSDSFLSEHERFSKALGARACKSIKPGPKCVETTEDCQDIQRNELLSPIRLVGDRVCATSPAATDLEKFPGSKADDRSSYERYNSTLKPILNIGDGDHPRRRRTETRESIKSVRWDPAVVSVGRRLVFDRPLERPLTPEPPPNHEDKILRSKMLEEYVKNVTQSMAKLKKSNPKVISQVLAALRDLKSDDESDDDQSQKQEGSKITPSSPEPGRSMLSPDKEARKQVKSASADAESAKQTEDLDPKNSVTAIAERVINDAKLAKNDSEAIRRTLPVADERYPEAIDSSLGKAAKQKEDIDQERKVPMSYADASKSPPKTSNVEKPDSFEASNLKGRNSMSYIDALKSPKMKYVQKPELESNSSPPKLNPTAPAFRDLSSIKFRAVQWQREDVEDVPFASHVRRRLDRSENATIGGSEDGRQTELSSEKALFPTAKTFKLARKPEVMKNEPIWINTSKPVEPTADYEAGDLVNPGQPIIDPNNLVPLAHIPMAQPLLKLQLPPGCVPLVPLSHFLPSLPMLPPPMLSFPHPMLPELQIAAPDVPESLEYDLADTDSAHQPSEDEHGRVARPLGKEWTEKLLKDFQARYPLTGTRAPQGPPLQPALPRVGIEPGRRAPIIPEPTFNVKAPARLKKRPKCHPSQLAKKRRAAEIQQQLEIKILELKEKEARDKKEIQMRAVENVNKYLAKMKLQAEGHVIGAQLSKSPQSSKVSITSPEWKKTWAALLKKINQKHRSAGLQQTPSSTSSPEVPGKEPKHVWEYLSMEESYSRALAEAQGLSEMPQQTIPKAQLRTPEYDIYIQQTQSQGSAQQGLSSILPRAGSIASMATPETKATEASWEHSTTEELNRALDRLQLASSPDPSPKPDRCLWEVLDLGFKIEELKSMAATAQGSSRSSSNTVSEQPSKALTHSMKSSMEELGKQLNFEFVSRASSTTVSEISLDSSDESSEGPSSNSKLKGKSRNSTDKTPERSDKSDWVIVGQLHEPSSRSTSGSNSSTWLIDLAGEAGEENEADDQVQE